MEIRLSVIRVNLGGDGWVRSPPPLHPPSQLRTRKLKRAVPKYILNIQLQCDYAVYVCGIYMSQPIPYSHRFPYAAHTACTPINPFSYIASALFFFFFVFPLLFGLIYRSSRAPVVRPPATTCSRLREIEREIVCVCGRAFGGF